MHTNHIILPSRFAFNQLDQALHRLLGQPFGSEVTAASTRAESLVPVDLHEDDTHYHAQFDLPGVRKEDITLKVQKGVLELSGKSQSCAGNCACDSTFHRELILPEDADSEAISAKLENGVLHLTIAKPAVPQVKSISIN